jgi:hypothetical protein
LLNSKAPASKTQASIGREFAERTIEIALQFSLEHLTLRENATQQSDEEFTVGLVEIVNVAQMRFNRSFVVTAHPPLIESLQDELARPTAWRPGVQPVCRPALLATARPS